MNISITLAALLAIPLSLSAITVTLVDDSTPAYYNGSIGTVLNGTSSAFPATGSADDPELDFPAAPDLSAAESQLGGWLQSPPSLNPQYWTPIPTAVQLQWAVESESAVVYRMDVPASGYTNVIMRFGVDNGIFVWLDGQYLGGFLRPGGASLGEHTFTIPSLAAGTHYVQVLREDHGLTNAYTVEITGEGETVEVQATIYTAVEVAWPTAIGSLYQVQTTESLSPTTWTNFGDPVQGNGSEMVVFDQVRLRQKRFYRVVQLQ